jgi:hypothetical protein
VPSTPTDVTATGGDGNATVSWSAPGDGGSPITAYIVTPYVSGVAQPADMFSSSATSEVVVGLSDGTTYSFTVAGANTVGSGVPSALSPLVIPLAPSLSIINAGTIAGRAQAGDQIIVTFSPAPSPSALCAAWTDTSYPDLVDSNVDIVGTQPSSGHDTVTVTDSADCSGGFEFGTIDLGQRGYFTDTTTFGGAVLGCQNGKTAGCSTIHWDGRNTLTITLGKPSGGQLTHAAQSVAVYVPTPGLGSSTTISSVKEENF